jgi:glutamine synthetase
MNKYMYSRYTHGTGICSAVCEYIWIDGKGSICSKSRVIKPLDINLVPEWNYDASSTYQAPSDGNTEGILKPVLVLEDPLRTIDKHKCLLVLCETYDSEGNPLKGNYRTEANKIFDSNLEEIPWFGLEQEYFIYFKDHLHTGMRHYCSTNTRSVTRKIVEEHLNACLNAGVKISGLNAEVAPNQWEFQIGPCEGITAADHLIVARYLLEKICEKHDAYVDYSPKPNSVWNGSGCHINFSTENSRGPDGMEYLKKYIVSLEKEHKNTLTHYGENNHLRLTGDHETSHIDIFSSGIGTRNTSVRIPTQVAKDGSGYLEDRRPAANIDPYYATSALFKAVFQGTT